MQILPSPDRDSQTRAIIGAGMNVHRLLGSGFLEVVYQEALAIEFGLRGVPFVREASFSILFRERLLQSSFRVDFLCFGEVLVELKAVRMTTSADESQVLNYLKASGKARALLLNFGGRSLVFKRFLGGHDRTIRVIQ